MQECVVFNKSASRTTHVRSRSNPLPKTPLNSLQHVLSTSGTVTFRPLFSVSALPFDSLIELHMRGRTMRARDRRNCPHDQAKMQSFHSSADARVLAAVVVLLVQLSYAAAFAGMPAIWAPRRGAIRSSSSSSSSSSSVPRFHHHHHHYRHHHRLRQYHHTNHHHRAAGAAVLGSTGVTSPRATPAVPRLCLGAASEDNSNSDQEDHSFCHGRWPVAGALTTTTAASPVNGATGAPERSVPPVVGDIRRESVDTLRVRPQSEGDAKGERASPRGNFVELFRGCAPYIRAHLGAVMVVHMGGEVLDDPGFVGLMDDLGLLSLLGVSGGLHSSTRYTSRSRTCLMLL